MRRPLVISALALICGIILSDVNNSHTWGIISLIICLSIFILLYKKLKAESSVFVLLAIPLLISGYFIHSMNRDYYYNACKEWEGKSVTVIGAVSDQPEFLEGKTRFTLRINSVDGRAIKSARGIKLQVSIYDEDPLPDLKYGSVIRLSGEIKVPQGRRNIGGFDMQKFYASRQISGSMGIPSKSLMIENGWQGSWLKNTGYILRQGMIRILDKSLPPKESSVIAGMLIGYTSRMPEEMEEDFRRAGLSHVMAVSGANIAFLLAPLLVILKKIGFNPRWSSALSFPLMMFYVFATGMEASVVRAAIMAGVTLTGMILWRKTDIYCSMAFSALVILLNNSFMLYDIGFILSYAATLSLVVFYKPIYERLPVKIPKFIRDTLAGTLAAQIGVIPVIAYCFNTFSLVSVLSNLLIVPITGFITILGALIAIVGCVFQYGAMLIGVFTFAMVNVMLFVTEFIAKIPWAEITIPTPDLVLVIIYYIIVIYIRYAHRKLPKDVGRAVLAGIIALCGTIILLTSVPNRALKIYFADVGQGDCIIIRTPKGKTIILDGGGSINDTDGSYVGERIVVPLLYNLNMQNIDFMIASHSDADHTGGLKTVLEKVKVHKLIVADAPDLPMQELIGLAEEKGVTVTKINEDDIIYEEEGLTIKAIYPFNEAWLMPRGKNINANDLGLVARLDYGDFSALFTGDIGFVTEKKLLEDNSDKEELSCDLLKVAHHGSKYSSDESFLAAVDPDIAIVSVGKNRYGHPSPEVMDRLSEEGCIIYPTIDFGGILVEVWHNEGKMRVTTVVN